MVLVFPSADLFKDSKLFPLFPQSPRKLFFLRQSRLSKTETTENSRRSSGGTGFFCDSGWYWFYPLLIVLILFRRYVISNFYFSKYSALIRLDAFTSLTIKSLVLLQFHFPSIFVIFTKKWIRVRGGAKSEDFHKTVSNLPPDFFFVQSWQIIFGSTFKNCRYLSGTLRLFCHSLHFTCSF